MQHLGFIIGSISHASPTGLIQISIPLHYIVIIGSYVGKMELHVHWFFHGGESSGMLEAFFYVHIGLCYVGCIHYLLLIVM
jgi:hypothetical protein